MLKPLKLLKLTIMTLENSIESKFSIENRFVFRAVFSYLVGSNIMNPRHPTL